MDSKGMKWQNPEITNLAPPASGICKSGSNALDIIKKERGVARRDTRRNSPACKVGGMPITRVKRRPRG